MTGPPPAHRRVGLEDIVTMASAMVLGIMAVFFVAITATQLEQARVAADSRAELAPTILDRHRMAINLHRMMAAGDLVTATVSPERRHEAALNGRAIAGHPAFLGNAEIRGVVGDAAEVIRDAAQRLDDGDRLADPAARHVVEDEAKKRWLEVRLRLEAAADGVVVETAAMTTDRFTELAHGSRRATLVTLGGLATSIVMVVALVVLARRLLVGPLVQAARALRQVHNRQSPDPLPATRIAEFDTLREDIEAVRGVVDALEAARQDLERSNADLEQFAYVASHDLREPLRMVTGFLGLIDRRYGSTLDAEGREFIAFASEGAHRMDQLVLDLLDYSRTGRVGKVPGPHPLPSLVNSALGALAGTIHDTGARVTVADGLPTVMVDDAEVTRLIQNLVSNALKYRAPDRPPEIAISAQRDGDWVRLDVADNGIGIEPEYFDRIFLLFQRLHTRHSYQGTGIGLAICKKVTERHGGRIWLDSVPGQGSTFHVTLPAA